MPREVSSVRWRRSAGRLHAQTHWPPSLHFDCAVVDFHFHRTGVIRRRAVAAVLARALVLGAVDEGAAFIATADRARHVEAGPAYVAACARQQVAVGVIVAVAVPDLTPSRTQTRFEISFQGAQQSRTCPVGEPDRMAYGWRVARRRFYNNLRPSLT